MKKNFFIKTLLVFFFFFLLINILPGGIKKAYGFSCSRCSEPNICSAGSSCVGSGDFCYCEACTLFSSGPCAGLCPRDYNECGSVCCPGRACYVCGCNPCPPPDPTATPRPPTATPRPPTATPRPPTATPGTPTNTPTPTSTVPTPTINPDCICKTDDTCKMNSCTFDKFAAPITYTDPIKCNLASSLFPTPPTTANKTSWCQAGKRTKGDADGNGIINNTDYFYYVAAVNGGKIPVTANPDFNGDGEVGAADRTIIIKSLNP